MSVLRRRDQIPKVPALPAASYQKIAVEPAERVLQGSDGKLRGTWGGVGFPSCISSLTWFSFCHDAAILRGAADCGEVSRAGVQ
eukprot:19117-Eustigmatos_ZCMA.PRE.1